MTNEKQKPNWFKIHSDTIATISIIVGGVLWLTAQFNNMNTQLNTLRSDFESKFSCMRTDFDARFTAIEKDICVIKTVMVVKNIMPSDLAKTNENGEKK